MMTRIAKMRAREAQYGREADQFYRPMPGGADVCARCGETREEHIFGDCADLKGVFKIGEQATELQAETGKLAPRSAA